MRQAEASAAPAARAPAKLLVRKAATPRGWTRCPGHPEDGPPDAGTPSSPGFGQGPPGPRPAVPRLGGHLAMSRHLLEPSAPRRAPSKPKPGLSVLAEAGALITPPAGRSSTRTCLSRHPAHLRMQLSTDAFCCRQRLSREKNTLFPPKRFGPKRKREPGEYSPVPAPFHQPAPSGSEPE